jgi:hypothetical protein
LLNIPHFGAKIKCSGGKNMLSKTEIQPTTAIMQEKVQITRLINSIFYFIDLAFILKKEDKFRLIALHGGRVLIDKTYQTIRGAKIAFTKFYKDKLIEDVDAKWSHFYPPDRPWLDQKLNAEKVH